MKRYVTSKFLVMIIGVLLFFGATAGLAVACHIDIAVTGVLQEQYETGDEEIVKVTVVLTHRNCPEGIDATQFLTDGLEVLGATPWEETSPNHFERLIKVKILSPASGEAELQVKRVCSKEGGLGVITLPVRV